MTYLALSLGWILLSIASAWVWHRWNRKTVRMDEPAFLRWLRAGRPPMPWFIGLAEIEQERLSQLGDQYSQDTCLGIGYAVRDPDIARAGRDPDANGGEGEVLLLEALLRAQAAKAAGMPATGRTDSPPQPSMAGLARRKEAAQAARQASQPDASILFGAQADPSAGTP